MKKNTIKVVIVDTGADTTHPIFQDKHIEGATLRIIDGQVIQSSDFSDENGHGTAIAGIIAKEAPCCSLFILKMFTVGDKPDDQSLLGVLRYIEQEIACDLINLSLGVCQTDNLDELKEVCEKIEKRGTLIVCAFENSGAISYPAAFDHVVGVTSGMHCNSINDFEFVDDTIVNLCGYGKKQRLAWLNHSYIMFGGNSFACAHVTAQAAKFLQDIGDMDRTILLQRFRHLSIHHYTMRDGKPHTPSFSIQKAILFPFTKEMHSFVRYEELIDFEIIGVYDTKYSGNVGIRMGQALKNWEENKLRIINNIHSISWDMFDTLILGHVDKLNQFSRLAESINDVVSSMMAHGKNIYAFDAKLNNLSENAYTHLFSPKVTNENLPANRFGKLYRPSKPVVGVFGTSSSQGKFSLQLELRKRFLSFGYKVGQIGTEPQSLLFGMDYVYPMGYGSSVEIEGLDAIRYLNNLVQNLCISGRDIIIAGSQSGTITYDYGNIAQYTLPQSTFLLGTLPDIVCLCINPFDDVEYIKRTIQFIKSFADTEVIALVVFPMGIVDNWRSIYAGKRLLTSEEISCCKVQFNTALHLPVYTLGKKEDMDQLFAHIIDYFDE